ncbi:hypothetical protein GA0115240_137821 [Streptomyces sp. DvalAA-14]|uniref:hypothetical protein n=1 Tax=unclassified Streptomyces TaxID=2593676 RepID=UPI00081B58E9|nr:MULTISPECIES: hypothetical protein [unclassified Streptomyces]SCE07662.1 hypothetical protein GA0115240_137821 [Streptomyces sp. DvalAA-14]
MTLILAASLLLLLLTLGYAGVCAVSPFGKCRKCNGLGFALATDRRGKPKRGKHCRRCNGHGIRIRTGRHLFNAWRDTYDRGTTPTTPNAPTVSPFTRTPGDRP